MRLYESPRIITDLISSNIAMSQYGFGQTPNCGVDSGDGHDTSSASCGNVCLGPSGCSTPQSGPDVISINFFLPESNPNDVPEFCSIKAVETTGQTSEVTGTSCHVSLLSECSDGSGAVWSISCEFPNAFCDADEFKVDCGGGAHTCNTQDLIPCEPVA